MTNDPANAKIEKEKANENETKFSTSLFDVVYGLVLSFTFLNLERIMFSTNKLLDPDGITLAVGAFFAYYLIISGWYGLRKSAENKKFNPAISWSKIRFALNLLIIFLEFYLVALTTGVIIDIGSHKLSDKTTLTEQNINWNNKEHLTIVYQALQKSYKDIFIWVIPAIYTVYLLWDIVKYKQFSSEKESLKENEKVDMKKRTIYTGTILASFVALAGFYSLIIMGYEAKSFSFSFSFNIIFIAISFGLVFIYRVILKGNKFKKVHYPKILVVVGCALIVLGIALVAQSNSTLGPPSWPTYGNTIWTGYGYVISLIGTVILILVSTLSASQGIKVAGTVGS